MFEPNKEDGLIQALSYEEMQSLSLVQGLSGNEHSVDVTDQIADEGEDAQDRNRSATIIFSDTVPSEFSQLMRHAPDDFETLLPKLLSSGGRVANLGRGLALAAEEPKQIWLMMTTALASNEKKNPSILIGFLERLREPDPVLTAELLDDALESSTLAPQFPILQIAAGLDDAGLSRLHRALEIAKAPIWQFSNLAVNKLPRVTPPPLGISIA